MKVTGFTFIKNALIYDYPVVESIKSILPLCDEFVVAVGKSDDDTYNLIKNIDQQKIRIVVTEWDETLKEGGRVLAVETDKALAQVSADTDWAFYIQGDEVVHEKYLETIYKGMQQFKDNAAVDGLLFKYLHFYGSYDYIGNSFDWYNNEIRIIRNNRGIYSYRDAQGFRKGDNEKLKVKPLDAYIYHYGWVKDPRAMQRKQENFHKLWHDEEWIEKNIVKADTYDYRLEATSLAPFKGTHPQVMKERIEKKNWKFDQDLSFNKLTIKDRIKGIARDTIGIEIGYKNYKII